MDATGPAGRRERHKARTRDDLQRAARELFARQGFAATTVGQIATAADVSERTFFRYFASKDDLLLDVAGLFSAMERSIRGRPLDEPPLVSVLESLVGTVAAATAARGGTSSIPGGGLMMQAGIDPADPVAAGRFVRVFVDWEDRLAAVLLDRFVEIDPDRPRQDLALRASVVARAAASAMRATFRESRDAPAETETPPLDAAGRLREAFGILIDGCTGPVAQRGSGRSRNG